MRGIFGAGGERDEQVSKAINYFGLNQDWRLNAFFG